MCCNSSQLRAPAGPRQRGLVKRWLVPAFAVMVGVSVLGAAEAQAALTNVGKSKKKKGEATHEQVLERRYGGDFVKNGSNYSNGTISVTRVDDSADTSFSGKIKGAQVIGRFSSKKQSFGVVADDGKYQKLIKKVKGKKFDASGAVDMETARIEGGRDADSSVVFARGGTGKKKGMAADPSMNKGGKDYLVTYTVSGGDIQAGSTTLLFWEDNTSRKSDFDFNDLILEISTEPLLIPLPAAAWSGLTGLIGLGAFAGFKRMRRRRTA